MKAGVTMFGGGMGSGLDANEMLFDHSQCYKKLFLSYDESNPYSVQVMRDAHLNPFRSQNSLELIVPLI